MQNISGKLLVMRDYRDNFVKTKFGHVIAMKIGVKLTYSRGKGVGYMAIVHVLEDYMDQTTMLVDSKGNVFEKTRGGEEEFGDVKKLFDLNPDFRGILRDYNLKILDIKSSKSKAVGLFMGLVNDKSLLKCQETMNKWSSGNETLTIFFKNKKLQKDFRVKIGYQITKQNLQIVYIVTFSSLNALRMEDKPETELNFFSQPIGALGFAKLLENS